MEIIATTPVQAAGLEEGDIMLTTNSEEGGAVNVNRGIIPTTIMDRIKEMMGMDVLNQTAIIPTTIMDRIKEMMGVDVLTTIMDRIKEMMGVDVLNQTAIETPIERGIHINTTPITATLRDRKCTTIESQNKSTAAQDEPHQRSTATLQNERKRTRIILLQSLPQLISKC